MIIYILVYIQPVDCIRLTWTKHSDNVRKSHHAFHICTLTYQRHSTNHKAQYHTKALTLSPRTSGVLDSVKLVANET